MSQVKPAFTLIGNGYLAWDSPEGEEKRFRGLFIFFLLLAFSLSVVIEMTTVPKPDRREVEKIPDRLAKLVLEKKKEEPPPPPPPKEELKKEEEVEKPKEPEKPKEKPSEVQVQKAREQATKAIAEAKEELAALQDLASAFDMGDAKPITKAGTAGSDTGMSRDIITNRSGKSSGGVNIGSTSSGGGGAGVAGGGKLAGGTVTKVESNLGAGAGEGPARKSASGKLERTEEEVRRIVERNNGALQAIYQRALRSNPTLKGAIVVRIVIAADGSMTTCDLVSSELNDPETERKLLTRLKAINFGAIEGVAVWDDKYTLNFFPS